MRVKVNKKMPSIHLVLDYVKSILVDPLCNNYLLDIKNITNRESAEYYFKIYCEYDYKKKEVKCEKRF